MNARELLDEQNQMNGKLGDSAVMQSFIATCMKAYEVSTLDFNTNQLIIIAMLCAADTSAPIIMSHVEMFVNGGGKREDLVSALNLVIIACGGPGCAWAGVALDAYDQLVAAKAQ